MRRMPNEMVLKMSYLLIVLLKKLLMQSDFSWPRENKGIHHGGFSKGEIVIKTRSKHKSYFSTKSL